MTPDPPIEALARTILRHQLGYNQPAQPPAWMTAAATEIERAMYSISWRTWTDDGFDDEPNITISDLATEINRRTQA